jgi:CHASE2 domain-containing sensor protein
LDFAHSFKNNWNKPIVGLLNFFGSAGFLGACFAQVDGSIIWQLLFFILAIGGLAFSILLKSKGVLVVSTLFLIAHFVYITSEYFADSIGWPISLVVLGFAFIGLGYVSININKKYFKEGQL